MARKVGKRDRGTGSLYQQPGSSNWAIQYFIHGKRQRESTGTDNKMKARKMLQDRLNAIASGNFLGAAIDRITVGDIVHTFLSSPKKQERRSLEDDQRRWDLHLKPAFEHVRASRLTTVEVNAYIEQRKKEPMVLAVRASGGTEYKTKPRVSQKFPSNGTINRELSLLRAAYRYALDKCNPPMVARVPKFEMLPESKPRSGFLSDERYADLAQACTDEGLWLRGALEMWWSYGWRSREPLDMLLVEQCDFESRQIRIEPGVTKKGEGRVVPMTDKIFELLSALCKGKRRKDQVFTHADGSPVSNFRRTWEKVCDEADCVGLLVHDLRRSGVRNLRRLGVDEGTIMKIAGMKTRSIFDRYNIVDETDLNDAVRKLNQRNAQRSEERGFAV